MAPLWSSQPLKTIYMIFFLLKTPPHLALLFFRYLAKPLRPLPEWDIKANISSAMIKAFFQYVTATRSQRTLYTEPGKAKERHSRIEPPADRLFSGVLAASETIKPMPVDGIWFPSPPPQDVAELKDQKVVLHFPGGAFIIAFGHQESGKSVADIMAKSMKATRTIWAQYRLAGTPETRFPAALQDALTFYQYVVSLGVEPENIILSGDSAGGNVVLALMRYLEHSQTQPEPLPLPGGAIVFSPWVHVTSHAAEDYDQSNNSRSDILVGPLLQWGADSYLPEGELPSGIEAYISPLHHPFNLSIPLFIHAGAAEAFHADIQSFADEMAQMNGNRVQFHATTLAPHDILLSHEAFGMTESLETVVEEACGFFDRENTK
ncbi:Esterase-like protein [Cladobotryum mycophilum]|uniref:Esterase-like protein n=1 Tax=Cladobotryum mycophilum TaxID=491253 RepID=A0ABR0SA76_9HYPO